MLLRFKRQRAKRKCEENAGTDIHERIQMSLKKAAHSDKAKSPTGKYHPKANVGKKVKQDANTGKIKSNEIEKDNKPVTKIKTFWRELEADHSVRSQNNRNKTKT